MTELWFARKSLVCSFYLVLIYWGHQFCLIVLWFLELRWFENAVKALLERLFGIVFGSDGVVKATVGAGTVVNGAELLYFSESSVDSVSRAENDN